MAAICVLWLTVATILALSVGKNQGHLVYGLDDAYIHMAMAKNAVRHHVWGVTRFGFSSSTSSPLWTLLLAGTYAVFGVNNLSPLVLNLLFGTLTLVCARVLLAKYSHRTARWMIFAVLLLVVVVTPMPWMTVVGMEHSMHALLTLCFVFLAAEQLGSHPGEARRGRVPLLVLAALLPVARYEGLFVVFVVCLLLLARRQAHYAVGMSLVALAPVVVYGLWSVGHGWWFLPNPLLLKGQQPDIHSLAGILNLLGLRGLTGLWHSPHIMVLVGAVGLQLAYFRFKRRTPLDSVRTYASLVFLGAVWLHLQFANVGWYRRYESYLMVLGLAALSTSLDDVLSSIRKWNVSRRALLYVAPVVPLLTLLAAPLYAVAYRSLVARRAMSNIFRQQYQMGLFLNRFYAGRAVALNDIGAVCYLADIRLLDLCGLGSLETAKSILQRNFSTRQIRELADGQRVAVGVVHDYLFEPRGGLPRQWTRVGIWKIPLNVVCGCNAVSLYATTPSAVDELGRNLRTFAAELPPEVAQFGKYLEDDEPQAPSPSAVSAGTEM